MRTAAILWDGSGRVRDEVDRRTGRLLVKEKVVNRSSRLCAETAALLTSTYSGEGVAMSFGGSELAIRDALARGMDRAILVRNSGIDPEDSVKVAESLSTAIRRIEAEDGSFDLIIVARRSSPRDTGFPGLMAGFLGLPLILCTVEMTVEGNRAIATSRLDGPEYRIQVGLPAVVDLERVHEPGWPTASEVHRAFSKEVKTLDVSDTTAEAKVGPSRFRTLYSSLSRGEAEVWRGEPKDLIPSLERSLTRYHRWLDLIDR